MRLAVFGDAGSVNVQRWCEGLVGTGCDVTALSFAPAWTPEVPVRQLRPASFGSKARYHCAVPAARRHLIELDPDLVIGYYASGYATTARLASRRPLVTVTAGRDVEGVSPASILGRLVRRNLQASALVIAWGPHMADAATALGADPDRIMVQPRGIPTSAYSRSSDVDRPASRIVCTRSLEPIYRHEVILEAFAAIQDLDASLTIVGDGSLRGSLEARVRDLGLEERVTFLGRISNDHVPTVLAEHDVYVSARPHDGVSASLLEAMAAGLLPIVARHPANEGWIEDGRTGLLVEPTEEALAEGLRTALSDRALRGRAAKAGPAAVAERGTLDANMPRFRDAFAALVGR